MVEGCDPTTVGYGLESGRCDQRCTGQRISSSGGTNTVPHQVGGTSRMEGRICAIETCLRVPPNPSRFEFHPGYDESRTHPQCHTDDESEMARILLGDGPRQ